MSDAASASSASVKRAAALSAGAAAFLTPFMSSSVFVALPTIGSRFHLEAVYLSWIATSYLLATGVLLLPAGRFADIHGRRKVFLAGLAVYAASSLASVIVPSAALLIMSRLAQGVGSAMIMSTTIAILTSVYPAPERGRAIGFNVASVYTGLSLGPVVAGFLTAHFGWRSVFLANGALGVVGLVIAVSLLRGDWADAAGESFDLTGAVIFGISLIGIIFGLAELPAMAGITPLLLGLVGVVAFGLWESQAASPLLNVRILRTNRLFAYSNLTALVIYTATTAVAFILSLYLQYVKGFSPEAAGFVLLAQPVVQATLSPVAGKLSDRVEPRVVVSIGLALDAVALGMMSFLRPGTGLVFIVGSLLLLGLGFALFSSPNTNAGMSSVTREQYGVANASLATMRLVGQMLSMGVIMLALSAIVGQTEITPSHYPAFLHASDRAFTFFASACALGVLASLARGNLRGKAGQGVE